MKQGTVIITIQEEAAEHHEHIQTFLEAVKKKA